MLADIYHFPPLFSILKRDMKYGGYHRKPVEGSPSTQPGGFRPHPYKPLPIGHDDSGQGFRIQYRICPNQSVQMQQIGGQRVDIRIAQTTRFV